MNQRFFARKFRLNFIRISIVIIPLLMFAFGQQSFEGGVIVFIVYFSLESLFFIRSIEITTDNLVLYYLFRTKTIPIAKIRKVEKSTWDSYKKITLYLVDGPIEILEGFVYSKTDILLIIVAINNKLKTKKGI